MKEETLITTKKVVVKCDLCGNVVDNARPCIGCGRDMCRGHRNWLYTDPWTGADNGDYPDPICHDCEPLLAPFAQEAWKNNQEAEEKNEALEKAWKEKCKKELNLQ